MSKVILQFKRGQTVFLNKNKEPYVILHTGKRTDNGETVKGFLFKVYDAYHIVTENDENTAYPVVEESIMPDSQNISLNFTTNVILHTGKRIDNGESITGFLLKIHDVFHIILENDEDAAYPVEENSIIPDVFTVQEEGERIVPAASLPEGWNWIHHEDASGHLQSSDGKSYFSYDWPTGEYKKTEDSEYSFFLGNFQDFQKEAEDWIKEHIL